MMDFLTSPAFALIGIAGVVGWVVATWLRIKHGYPLEGSWGQALKPVHSNETTERLRLLTSENAQLQAELGAIKDRLHTLERIATDEGRRLSREIDDLRH